METVNTTTQTKRKMSTAKIVAAVLTPIVFIAGTAGAFVFIKTTSVVKAKNTVRDAREAHQKLYTDINALTSKAKAFNPTTILSADEVLKQANELETQLASVESSSDEVESTTNKLTDKKLEGFKGSLKTYQTKLDEYIKFEKEYLTDLEVTIDVVGKVEKYSTAIGDLNITNPSNLSPVITQIDSINSEASKAKTDLKGKAKNQELDDINMQFLDAVVVFTRDFKVALQKLDSTAITAAGVKFGNAATVAGTKLDTFTQKMKDEEQKAVDALNQAETEVQSEYDKLSSVYKLK